ncbi:MAG: hypothetical protein MI799_19720 [Desulfobacterales bacterium]|nr:hypothetical protein [Desulfobacterales bacterium]
MAVGQIIQGDLSSDQIFGRWDGERHGRAAAGPGLGVRVPAALTKHLPERSSPIKSVEESAGGASAQMP